MPKTCKVLGGFRIVRLRQQICSGGIIMVTKSKSSRIFTELYPVRISNFPKLYAWKIATSASENKSLAWKIGYCLRRDTDGH